MSSPQETPNASCSRGQKRDADADKKRRQEEVEMKRQRTMLEHAKNSADKTEGSEEEEVQANLPDQVGCSRCQDLDKMCAEKDLKIKELEEQLKSLKQKSHQDAVSKLVQEVDEPGKVKFGEERMTRDKPIFVAILEGQSKAEIQRLVESGEEWDVPNADGDTVLHVAAKAGRSELIEYFFSISDEPKPKVNVRNSSGFTPFMVAAESGKNFLQVFDVLKKSRADIRAESWDGYNCLLTAIIAGRSAKEIEKIVASTPNWNFVSTVDRDTVLHVATRNGNMEALKYLLSLSPDFVNRSINSQTATGETPLMNATFAKKYFRPMVRLLLKHGADITFRNKWGMGVIYCAIARRRTSEELEFLIAAGATWNTGWTNGKSVLHVCAMNGNVEAMRYFIGKGANVNAVDNDGFTPVMKAARWMRCDAMNFLIENGAEFEASKLLDLALSVYVEGHQRLLETIKSLSEHGETLDDASRVKVFHEFVKWGTLKGIRHYILNGVDVNVKDSNGRTPLMRMFAKGWGPKLEVFDLLMEMGADVHAVDNSGFNVLHVALRESGADIFLEIFQKLIQHGATWSNGVVGEEPHQESILHAAVRGGNPEVVQFFVSKGVDVNAKSTMGDTPFLHAVRKDVFKLGEILRVLVNGGADPNAVDNEGNTALIVGMKVMLDREYLRPKEKLQLAPSRLLVALGCDSRIPNDKGETVLSVLKDHGKFHLLKYFKSSV